MSVGWDAITHITKVDPAEPLPNDIGVLEGTDLIMVGGSDAVTVENSLAAIEHVAASYPELPICQEPFHSSQVSTDTMDAVDFLTVPAVYNGDRDHFVGKHLSFFTQIGEKPAEVAGSNLPLIGEAIQARGRAAVAAVTESILGEGYVIQNVDSKAARVSGVETPFTPAEVAGAAIATESFFQFPIFYIEYSGMYGGSTDVEAAAAYLDDTILLYGGGIKNREQTHEILAAGADAVVVGDCFHDDPDRFKQTIP